VLKEDERRSAFRAEAPVCVADSVGLDEAGWSRDVGVFSHIYLRGYRSGCCCVRNWHPNPEDAALQFPQRYRRSFQSAWVTRYSAPPRLPNTDAIKREGESIGRWCRRYFRIGSTRRAALRQRAFLVWRVNRQSICGGRDGQAQASFRAPCSISQSGRGAIKSRHQSMIGVCL
jgi:hypothetical protein